MKKYIFILALAFCLPAANNLFAQTVTDEQCKTVHTGTFYEFAMPYITIVRDSAFQVETDTRTGEKSTYEITWTDPCTYELKFVSSDKKHIRKASKKMGVIKVTITYVDDEGYSYIASAPGLKAPMRGKIKWKK